MQRGLKEKSGSSKTFMTVARGKFIKRVSEPTDRSTERALEKGPNAGKIVHEESYDEFIGQLLDINVDDHDQFGKSWEFTFDITPDEESEAEHVVLKVPYSSGYANNILGRLPNLDLDKDVLVSGYCFRPKDKDKDMIGISLKQENKDGGISKVPPAYTKEEPNGCPELKKIKVKGKEMWDDTDRLEFLEAMVYADIKPRLADVSPNDSPGLSEDYPEDHPLHEEQPAKKEVASRSAKNKAEEDNDDMAASGKPMPF